MSCYSGKKRIERIDQTIVFVSNGYEIWCISDIYCEEKKTTRL